MRNQWGAAASFEGYQARNQPGIHKARDDEQPEEVGGDPTMRQRAKLRKWCRPMGPIGLLLESVHLQSASIDSQWRYCQFNQTPIDIVDGPAQLLSPLLLRAAARNRTARAEGSRKETAGLIEIDTYATNAKHKEEVPKEKQS